MSVYQKRYFGLRDIRNSPSKKNAFPNTCPRCGKPLRRNTKNKVGNICTKCGPGYKQRPEFEASACRYCFFEKECQARVFLGIWVRCETPDFGDLERLRINEKICDEDLLNSLDLSITQKGNRNFLEEAIARKIPEVYEGFIESNNLISLGLLIFVDKKED